MISADNTLPTWVAAFKVTGEVTKEDYDNVVLPTVDRIYKQHGHLHFLLELNTPVSEFKAGAWMKDAALGIKHFTHWKKIAIVSDQTSVEKISNLISPLIPGKTRGFSLDELEEAKNWVASEDQI